MITIRDEWWMTNDLWRGDPKVTHYRAVTWMGRYLTFKKVEGETIWRIAFPRFEDSILSTVLE